MREEITRKIPTSKEKSLTSTFCRNKTETSLKTCNFSPKSHQNYDIYDKMKIKQFTKIFKLLDQDEDGKITDINAAVKNIPIQILKIIKPIITQMEEDLLEFDMVLFIEECCKIFNVFYVNLF